ncbi:MAG: PEGA domain-containing protein [Ignavibacteriaceae bacterium]|nr:PEGA domain-containing protein [Ignavibacteriaceae bacterium]MCW8812004.1 PEGA domain-containing protein [Chlorobium sp.]MCW8816882.1 PEGA domain-containing protein [Ignavibacteriaceae bacterium]MCW8961070.1 PEGA domain-containing protein [Ignavibacteriaceae bacterium]MCW9098167.1 PEGA domain-containing protein [Ignavibacteriaceae bacterium]
MKRTLRKTRKIITFILLFTTILAIILVGLLNKELYKEMVSIITEDIYPAILALLVLFGFVVRGVVKNPPKSFDKFLENGLLQIAVLEMFLFIMGLIIFSIYKTGTGTILVLLEPEIQGPKIKALEIWESDSANATTKEILVPNFLPSEKPGKYTFRLIEKGYFPDEKPISLKAFDDVTIVLKADKITGTLIVNTEPKGAEIWIDASLKAHTPDTLNLGRKKINLLLKLKGYLTYEKKDIDLKSNPLINLGTITLLKLYKIKFICLFNDIEFTVNNQTYKGSRTILLPGPSDYTITSQRGNELYIPKKITVNMDDVIAIP